MSPSLPYLEHIIYIVYITHDGMHVQNDYRSTHVDKIDRYCVGNFLGSDDDSSRRCLDSMNNLVRYKASLYYAFTTMTTIGYGDISPSPYASAEIGFGIFGEVLGTMVFAYVIGSVVVLILNFDPAANLRAESISKLNEVRMGRRVALSHILLSFFLSLFVAYVILLSHDDKLHARTHIPSYTHV
jgi:hypothetical protein